MAVLFSLLPNAVIIAFIGSYSDAHFFVLAPLLLVQIVALALMPAASRAFLACFYLAAAANIVMWAWLVGHDMDLGIVLIPASMGGIAYVALSARVQVTYRRRVARDDEWLKKGMEAAGEPLPPVAPAQ